MSHEATLREHLDALAKPPGSLGQLESLAVRLAGAQRSERPSADVPRVLVFAGDHGVARAQAVSPYPSDVTKVMVATFAAGRAAVSSLARNAGATLEVVDVGVCGPPPPAATAAGVSVVHARVADGTADLSTTAAMTDAQCKAARDAGAAAMDRAVADGVDVVAVGEMGIGNTTPASALAARLLGRPAVDLVGPGTGLDASGVQKKAEIVQRALDRGGPAEPLAALADLGGLELAALVGCIHRAEELDVPVVLDGFIVGSAALAAVRARPSARRVLVPATHSAEPGHRMILEALDVGPALLDLDLRLGEASGATLALPLLRAACALPREMATLAEVLGQAQGEG